jgi:hypothetical protein
VRDYSAIRGSACPEDEQYQRQEGESDLDVLPVDLLGKDKKIRELVFHFSPLGMGLSSNDTPGQASRVASNQAGWMRRSQEQDVDGVNGAARTIPRTAWY